ncbi:MAG: TMEM175 family protein [Dehalococcoidia bacterium]
MEDDVKLNREKDLSRLLALTDGVFAFAITLLIVNVALPAGTLQADLPVALKALWPKYTAFIISFIVIGLYWTVHVRQFRIIMRYNTQLMWLNLLFLMFIVIIPFSTTVLSDYHGQLPVTIYAANMACAGFAATGTWLYATQNHRLVVEDLSRGFVKRGIILRLVAPIIFSLSIGVAFFNTTFAQFIWVSIFVLHFILSRMYRAPEKGENI